MQREAEDARASCATHFTQYGTVAALRRRLNSGSAKMEMPNRQLRNQECDSFQRTNFAG
jgi:hypothetical protein